MERALAIDEKALGENHPTVAIRLNNLGQLLQATGAYEAALAYLQRVLQIKEKSLPPNHPNTIIGQDNLAALIAKWKILRYLKQVFPPENIGAGWCGNALGKQIKVIPRRLAL